MAFQRSLTDIQEEELIEDCLDGWTVNELSVIYRVSIRTVYRVLAKHDASKNNRRKRKRRVQKRLKKRPPLKPCGTNAAYARHKRKGEYPCTACLEAHAEDVAKAKGKK